MDTGGRTERAVIFWWPTGSGCFVWKRNSKVTNFTQPSEAKIKVLHFPFLRNVARTKSWTPWHKLSLAFLHPFAIAITHNSLLRLNASSQRVKFVHPESLLKQDVNWRLNADLTQEILSSVL